MESDTQKMLDRIAEEQQNKCMSDKIICPYCKTKQDDEITYQHVSYWGEDSKKMISCENCSTDFYVEEIVSREFETTTREWEERK